MADPADTKVDSAVARMQSLLDELKGAQAKDEEDEPKDLREAGVRVRAHFRRRRAQADDLSKNMGEGGRVASEDGNKPFGTRKDEA